MRPFLLSTILATAVAALAMPGAASAQTAPAQGGHICRGLLSANAAGKEWGFVWVRVNADNSADVWTSGGSQVAPEAIPPLPPKSAKHTVTPAVSRFGNDFVGVNMQTPLGASVMLQISESAHVMATPRQRSAIACTP